jgi:hypothetical protein
MSRHLFAAGRIPSRRTVTFDCPECGEPEAIAVAMHFAFGMDDLGYLEGWEAGNVIVQCGCTLAEHQCAALRTDAEDRRNGVVEAEDAD